MCKKRSTIIKICSCFESRIKVIKRFKVYLESWKSLKCLFHNLKLAKIEVLPSMQSGLISVLSNGLHPLQNILASLVFIQGLYFVKKPDIKLHINIISPIPGLAIFLPSLRRFANKEGRSSRLSAISRNVPLRASKWDSIFFLDDQAMSFCPFLTGDRRRSEKSKNIYSLGRTICFRKKCLKSLVRFKSCQY